MSDNASRPLTDAERAELEELRAEKARREEAERAARERAELEALREERLRAERASSDAGNPAPARSPESPSASRGQQPAKVAARTASSREPDEKTFAERMVTTDHVDADGVPSMPPAQIAIIVICVVAVIIAGVYMFG